MTCTRSWGLTRFLFLLVVFPADAPSHCFPPTFSVSLDSVLIFTSQCFCGSSVLQDVSTISWDAAVPSRLSSGLLQTLLKAPTAPTSITLQSTRGVCGYRTLTDKLILTMLFKITHWWGPEGCQAKKMTVDLPCVTECGMSSLPLLDEPNFPDWTMFRAAPALQFPALGSIEQAKFSLPTWRSCSASRELRHCHIPWWCGWQYQNPGLAKSFLSSQEKFWRKVLLVQYFAQEDFFKERKYYPDYLKGED